MGEFVWENPVFWSFFAKIYTVPVSPEERKRRMGRGWPGDAEHKKSSQRNESHWLDLSHYSNDTMRGLLETGT